MTSMMRYLLCPIRLANVVSGSHLLQMDALIESVCRDGDLRRAVLLLFLKMIVIGVIVQLIS